MEDKIKEIMGLVFGMAPSAIGDESGRQDIPKWDSAAHIELVLALESEFGVQFADEEVIGLVNYKSIHAALERLLNQSVQQAGSVA